MLTRARAFTLAAVIVLSVFVGVFVSSVTGRPMALVVAIAAGALIASIVMIVATGSRQESPARSARNH